MIGYPFFQEINYLRVVLVGRKTLDKLVLGVGNDLLELLIHVTLAG